MNDRYINAAQQRLLSLLFRLAGHEIDGLAPGELAKALRTTPSNITRDLANLAEAGVAEKLGNDRWRLTPRVVQLSLAASKTFASAQDRLHEIQQRYTRDAR